MSTFYIGIDFSLNSTGVCLLNVNTGELNLLNLIKPFNLTNKELNLINNLQQVNEITVIDDFSGQDQTTDIQNSVLTETYTLRNKALTLVNMLNEFVQEGDSVILAFEGFSLGSKGNSLVDIAQCVGMLKTELVRYLNAKIDNIYSFAPNSVKKVAGKGNFTKPEMLTAFINHANQHYSAQIKHFLSLIQSLPATKKVPKPIDDIVDSYFVMQTLKQSLK